MARPRLTLLLTMASLFALPVVPESQARSAPRVLLPTALPWVANPALPAGARMAVLTGALAAGGRYSFRLEVPRGMRVMPHTHPEDRTYTVISGPFSIGFGASFDEAAVQVLPPGAFCLVPANTPHFHWARDGESVVQIDAVGPTATVYVDPAHDPRRPR